MKHSRSFSSLSLLLVVSLVLTAFPNLGPTPATSAVSAAITDSQTISPPNLEEVEAEAPYTVSSNQDPMLTEIALRGSSSGRFGPFISNEPPAEYAHAYEPPISNDERTTCPKNGCDYVEGRLLIKFQPNVVSLDQSSKQALVQSDEILNSFETLGISNLTPVFPHAKSPEANSFISDVDGNLVPEPI